LWWWCKLVSFKNLKVAWWKVSQNLTNKFLPVYRKTRKGRNVASSFTELHGYNLKDWSLFWDYPTFLELKCLFLYKMIGNGRYIWCCPCVLFKIKIELTWPKKNLKTLCLIQSFCKLYWPTKSQSLESISLEVFKFEELENFGLKTFSIFLY